MTASSAVNTSSNGVSPWQALHGHQKGSTDSSSASDDPWSESALWSSPTDSGSAASSDSTDASSSNSVSSAVEQLIAGLQSFLVNLQSASPTATTDADGVTAADSATTGTTTAASCTATATATASADPGSFDLSSILADLQDASASGPFAPPPPPSDSADSTGTATQQAAGVTATTDTGSNQPQSLADILSALQSYTAPFNTAAAGATTSLTA